MIQVKPAQEHLVRFARAAVLRHDQARNRLQHVSGAREGADGEIHLSNDRLGRTACLTRQVLSSARDHELFECFLIGVRLKAIGQTQQV